MIDDETLRLYEQGVDRTGTLSRSDCVELLCEYRRLRGCVEEALRHYRIGELTREGGLYVAWPYVADRMAQALQGEAEDGP